MMETDKVIYDRLYVDIYTIGYDAEGESIVFIIRSGTTVLYTGVIDSYEKNKINKTRELLDTLKISKINMLCWSHPDGDHSKGFTKLFELLDKDSVFVVPSNIVEYKTKIQGNFKEIWDFLENEQLDRNSQCEKKYIPKKCEIQFVAKNTEISNLPCFNFVNGNTKYQFMLKCFLPISQNTYKGIFNMKEMAENGFSVGLFLQVGEFCAVFASDCHDDYIIKIDSRYFTQYCDFLKIPHHGSKTSTKILELFTEAFNHGHKIEASSVTKKTILLPADESLKKYNKTSNHLLFTNEKDNGFNYGISKVSVDVTDVDFDYKYSFEGNAYFKNV